MTKEHTGHKTDDGDSVVDSQTWVLAECDRFGSKDVTSNHGVASLLLAAVCSCICGMGGG
jgi:hypothetical protein